MEWQKLTTCKLEKVQNGNKKKNYAIVSEFKWSQTSIRDVVRDVPLVGNLFLHNRQS